MKKRRWFVQERRRQRHGACRTAADAHAQGAELAGAPADDCTGARQVKKRALGAIYTLK
jgi:hypothetical protein